MATSLASVRIRTVGVATVTVIVIAVTSVTIGAGHDLPHLPVGLAVPNAELCDLHLATWCKPRALY